MIQILLAVLMISLSFLRFFVSPSDVSQPKPNIVIVLTDDEPAGMRDAMPFVSWLASRGFDSSETSVDVSLCCPSRATILSGGMTPWETGVWTIFPPNGGEPKFRLLESDALPVHLQRAGYATGLFGKYMNSPHPTRIPPGWSHWSEVLTTDSTVTANVFKTGASGPDQATTGRVSGEGGYLTDILANKAVRWVKSQPSGKPLFLYFTPIAPHAPAATAIRHRKIEFPDAKTRLPGFADASGKPAWLQENAAKFNAVEHDLFELRQMRSLRAVDEAVERIYNAFRDRGELDRTWFFITSDNGLERGRFGWTGKQLPYLSLRVPLTIVGPGVISRKDSEHRIVMDRDVPATIIDLLGLNMPTEGMSLLLILKGEPVSWRKQFFAANVADGLSEPLGLTWTASLFEAEDGKWYEYIEWATGEREFYNLTDDGWMLTNLYASKEKSAFISSLIERASREVEAKKPLAVVSESVLPDARFGQPYRFRIETQGGTRPFTWTARGLPDGLRLLDGEIAGTPLMVGRFTPTLTVRGQSLLLGGKVEEYSFRFSIEVK